MDRHRAEGHAYAEQALALAEAAGNPRFVATCRAMELSPAPAARRPRRSRSSGRRSAPRTTGLRRQPRRGGRRPGPRAVDARRAGEAVDVAREAARTSQAASDWQVTATAQWLLVEMEAQTGVPGAAAGRSYASLLSRVLWQQRLSTSQGAHAALQVERLHQDNIVANRAAHEDPLTGVGNRRALDDAMRAVQADAFAAAATYR